uniref:Transposase n=1 Tax=Loa loa TaxID=7209 RepID=A0A1I7VP40_LOALO
MNVILTWRAIASRTNKLGFIGIQDQLDENKQALKQSKRALSSRKDDIKSDGHGKNQMIVDYASAASWY